MSIKIWDIVSGPISKEDSDDPDDYPNNCNCMLVLDMYDLTNTDNRDVS